MASFLDDRERRALLVRLAALNSASRPRWGKFTVGGMLFHLRESARMATGTLPVADRRKTAFKVFPLKHLILYVLPFPKGAPTAEELLPSSDFEFDDVRTGLRDALDAFVHADEGPMVAHPLFGPLTRAEWGTLMYKHMDHHLRQFGV